MRVVRVDDPGAGRIDIGTAGLDREVHRHVHAGGQRERRPIDRDWRDADLGDRVAIVVEDGGAGRDVDLEPRNTRCRHDDFGRGRVGDRHHVLGVEPGHPDDIGQGIRVARLDRDVSLEGAERPTRAAGGPTVDREFVLAGPQVTEQEPARVVARGDAAVDLERDVRKRQAGQREDRAGEGGLARGRRERRLGLPIRVGPPCLPVASSVAGVGLPIVAVVQGRR